jgi:hypothetical protein
VDREGLIVELLRLRAEGLNDVREGVSGDGGSVPIRSHGADCQLRRSGLRCSCWVRSLDELARCIRLMMAGGRSSHNEPWTAEAKTIRRQWSAMHKRYVIAERRPMTVAVVKGRPSHPGNMLVLGLVNRTDLDKKGSGVTRVLCETWKDDVDIDLAAAGVRWLASAFRGPLNLPRELLVKDAA